MFPESDATEAPKQRKVTHVSERHSDRGAIKEKGHPCFQKVKRRRMKKRERSRMFPGDEATEATKQRKVTHFSRR